MSAEVRKEIQLEIAHVLFIDIVGYSKLLITEQSELLRRLSDVVRETEQFRIAEAESKLVRLPTGDGMALVFRNNPEAPVKCALELSKKLKVHPELSVRMGIHSGSSERGRRRKRADQHHRSRNQRGATGDGLRRRRAYSPLQTCGR
jgi:class 3 adenylate cyclase